MDSLIRRRFKETVVVTATQLPRPDIPAECAEIPEYIFIDYVGLLCGG